MILLKCLSLDNSAVNYFFIIKTDNIQLKLYLRCLYCSNKNILRNEIFTISDM